MANAFFDRPYDYDLPRLRYSPEYFAGRRNEQSIPGFRNGEITSISGHYFLPRAYYEGTGPYEGWTKRDQARSDAEIDKLNTEMAQLQAEIAAEQAETDRINAPYNARLLGKPSALGEGIENRIQKQFINMYGSEDGLQRYAAIKASRQPTVTGRVDPAGLFFNTPEKNQYDQYIQQTFGPSNTGLPWSQRQDDGFDYRLENAGDYAGRSSFVPEDYTNQWGWAYRGMGAPIMSALRLLNSLHPFRKMDVPSDRSGWYRRNVGE